VIAMLAESADMLDELDEASRALVEIPLPLSGKAGWALAAVLAAGTVPSVIGLCFYIGLMESLLRPLPALWICLLLTASLFVVRHCLAVARSADFVIDKHGIQVHAGQGERFLEWGDISSCHWSHYEPGVLNIQVMDSSNISSAMVPPTRLFYWVPAVYRPGVEKAIRAMGRWAERETALAPVPLATADNELVGVKPATLDGLDGATTPLVEIPYSSKSMIASFFWVLFVVVNVGGPLDLAGPPTLGRWLRGIMVGLMTIVSAALVFSRAKYSEFAVEKVGIRLPIQRRASWSSTWSLRNLGLFTWAEVSYCRWSRYEPGLLQVQVKATRSRDKIEQPPMRLVYRVPEQYQAQVEKAVRAMGRWAD
jgi:hypothetical protein